MRRTHDRPRRRSRRSVLESRKRWPCSPQRLRKSHSQPSRHYLTRSKKTVSVRRSPPCLVRFSCPVCSLSTPIQAVKVVTALLDLAATLTLPPAPSLWARRHLLFPKALNSRGSTCRDRSPTPPTLMTVFRPGFLSYFGRFYLIVSLPLFSCLPFSLRRGASGERVDSSLRTFLCCWSRCTSLPALAAISTRTILALFSAVTAFFCGELRTAINSDIQRELICCIVVVQNSVALSAPGLQLSPTTARPD